MPYEHNRGFTFQKSIKSQRGSSGSRGLGTVSHFKRASNHNNVAVYYTDGTTVSHFKRASNHNLGEQFLQPFELFHISKEHQITTSALYNQVEKYYSSTIKLSKSDDIIPNFLHFCGTVIIYLLAPSNYGGKQVREAHSASVRRTALADALFSKRLHTG